MEVVQWFHNRGFVFPDASCKLAAASGKIEILKWVRENYNLPWTGVGESALQSMWERL